MFQITSIQAINVLPASNFKLKKGVNEFASRDKVPAGAWPRLDRFRAAGIVAFEAAPKDPGRSRKPSGDAGAPAAS